MVMQATFAERVRDKKLRMRKATLEPRHPNKPYPRLLERKYERQLAGTVIVAFDVTKTILFPRLPGIVAEARLVDGRFDDYIDTVAALMQTIKIIFTNRVPPSTLETMASDQAWAVNKHSAAVFASQINQVAGVMPFVTEPWLVPTLKSFTKNNVSLISSVHESYFKDVENAVYDGLETGLSNKEIEKRIIDRTGVHSRHAKLIARDQTGKLNSNLAMKRATSLGVKKFRWVTSADERVRSSHAAVNNKIYTYKDGAYVDGVYTWPGQPIQCRCTAVPIISSIDETE